MTKEKKAILVMIFACFMAGIMTSLLRYTSQHVNIPMLVFFRNIFGLLFFLPWLVKNKFPKISRGNVRIHGYRTIISIFAMYGWFYSVSVVNLSIATSLTFLAPLISVLLAMVFLGEKANENVCICMLVGFVGTIIILRPGTSNFDQNALIVIICALLWSVGGIIVKQLTKEDSATVTSFYLTLIMSVVTLFPALAVWEPVSFTMYMWLLLLGLIANIFQISIAKAISLGDFKTIMPYDFTRLIFVSIMAYLFFGEVIDLWTVIGGGVIFSSAIFATYYETRMNKSVAASAK